MLKSFVKSWPPLLLALLLPACSSVKMDNVWPFKEEAPEHLPRRLANATEYQCEAGKRFYIRFEDKGNTAWVIYPDREVALAKDASGKRYTNGVAVLEIDGNAASLSDGPTVMYKDCKIPGGK